MSDIVIARVDQRLIHGQVIVQWCLNSDIDMIVVVNNEVANSTFQQGLMDMAVPSAMQTRYLSVAECLARYKTSKQDNKILLVVKQLDDLSALIEGGLPIQYVNIAKHGFMMDAKKKQQIKQFMDANIHVTLKDLPQDEEEDLSSLLG